MVCLGIIGTDFTTQAVSNTTSKTEFFSFTIPADTLQPGRLVRIKIAAFVEQNTGSAGKEIDLQLEFDDGVSTPSTLNLFDVEPHIGNQAMTLSVEILPADSISAQRALFEMWLDAADPQSGDENYQVNGNLSTFTLDGTEDIEVTLYATLSDASASFALTKKWAYIELV